MFNYWHSPRVPAEIWARAVSNVAENVSAATRINNDILFSNIDVMGRAFERAKQHTEELSRINVNNEKQSQIQQKKQQQSFQLIDKVYR